MLMTACGGAGSHPSADSAPPSVPASGSPSASPTLSAADAAKAKILATYQGFWKIQEEAYSTGNLNGLPVNTYAVGQAAAGITSSVDYYNSQHLVVRGHPQLSPQVTSVNLTTAPYSATITDCVDTTTFVPVDATTGQPEKLNSSVHRHIWTFTATYDNVQWYINSGSINRSGTC
ncbi:hypothetical protein [Streptacidiphilus sp. EB129]|uniref:hypothetical protein n=1 Tax=Streptacidiphilus sp. EB129 TaxID=3156262 RepID=UPI0035198CC8